MEERRRSKRTEMSSTLMVKRLDQGGVKNGNVLGVIAKSKQDVPYLKQYLTDVVKKTAPSYHYTGRTAKEYLCY